MEMTSISSANSAGVAMPIPAISVAMSVYNGAPYLAEAIESILNQTFTDFEFLILNDGSKDTSAAIIDRYAAQDNRIRAIHRENRGLIVSLNQLLEEAQAPIIARMDGDDIAMPERFARQYEFLAANPDHGVVSSWTIDIDGNGVAYTIEGNDHPTSFEAFLAAIETGPLLCHPSAMFRRDLVMSVGGYHAAFRHCEDYDLWLRMADITKLCSLPERLMKYRHTDGQVSSKHLVEQQIGVAASRFARRMRLAGKPDPTADLDRLPPMADYDALFGEAGISKEAQAMVASSILYSPIALKGQGFDIVMDHVRGGGSKKDLPRTVLRLLRFGEPIRAARLALALLLN
jgi:glycosyltransferase involved in cell wall biosynthesis